MYLLNFEVTYLLLPMYLCFPSIGRKVHHVDPMQLFALLGTTYTSAISFLRKQVVENPLCFFFFFLLPLSTSPPPRG